MPTDQLAVGCRPINWPLGAGRSTGRQVLADQLAARCWPINWPSVCAQSHAGPATPARVGDAAAQQCSRSI